MNLHPFLATSIALQKGVGFIPHLTQIYTSTVTCSYSSVGDKYIKSV